MFGGYEEPQVASNKALSAEEKQIASFVQSKVPLLANANVVFVRKQVVAGMNYCFTFDANPNNEYCVWSKPWEKNFLQLTTPEG